MWYERDYAVSYNELKKDMGDALSVSLIGQDAGSQVSELWFQNFMAEVLREVSVSHPEHKFVVTSILNAKESGPTTKYRSLVKEVAVYVQKPPASLEGLRISLSGDKSPTVGKISVSVTDKGLYVRFANARIERAIKKGVYIRTAKLKRAKEMFGAYFHPTTLAERMRVPRQHMKEMKVNNLYVAHSVTKSFCDTVGACMVELSRANPVDFVALLQRIGSTQKEAEDWLARMQEADILNSMENVKYVHTNSEEVVIVSENAKVLDSYPQNKLPKTLATKLGLMRVANEKAIVREVGMRYDDNNFMIIGEYEDE
jgi:hypothetical protein